MRKVFLFLILTLTTGCHHAGDFFRHRTAPVEDASAGVKFYDWWRTQSGANIISLPDGKDCLVMHVLGYEIGRLPGRFCLLLPKQSYFSLADQATLYNHERQVVWRWSPPAPVRDVRLSSDKASLWFWMEDGEQTDIRQLKVSGAELLLTWKGQSQDVPDPVREHFGTRRLANGNSLEAGRQVIERNGAGRLVWQWQSGLNEPAWIERVDEFEVADYLKIWQRP
jgi:hypothetical protein